MNMLTVVAKIKAKSGSEAALRQELLTLIPPTLKEEGCLSYDLHRSIEDEGLFLFYESWANQPLWEQHMDSDHLRVFQAKSETLVEAWELFLMQPEQPTP